MFEGRVAPLLGIALLVGLVGCPSTPTEEADGGIPPDAGGSDSGSADAGLDGGIDSGVDGGLPVDGGGSDGGSDAGSVPCVPPVNRCDAGDYVDDTDAGPVVDVFFGDAGFPYSYQPRCVRIASGQSLRFQGPFGVHPLRQSCGPALAIPFYVSGTSHTVAFSQPGDYGFICTEHWMTFGMMGAADVVP